MRFIRHLRFIATALIGVTITTLAHALPTIVIAPGTSPAGGYLPLSLFGISSMAAGDDTITNFIVPTFDYAGQTWSNLGVVSNGYVVVGGGTSADVLPVNTSLPDLSAPGNILAPFWTDLDLSTAGGLRIGTLTDGADTWIVVDWEKVPTFNEPSELNSFEVWIGLNTDAHPGEDISFAYNPVGNGDGGHLTVGAQDVSHTVGDTYYYNGTGTAPVHGTQLRVTTRDLPVDAPEPATLALFSLGLVGLAASRRRRQQGW